MDIALTVIIPAYNEALRLPAFLRDVRAHMEGSMRGDHEVIVVDDGSDDELPDVLRSMAADWPELVVIRHEMNRGKGAAVRTGMLAGQGRLLLFADADGATPIEEEARLREAIGKGADLAVGSRLAFATHVTRRRTRARGLFGRVFAGVARRWLRVRVRDTQCGFKMFRRDIAQSLFNESRESGYVFDLELLMLAEQRALKIAEVPVNWSDMPGGHLRPSRDLIPILVSLVRLRRRHQRNGPRRTGA